MHIRVDSTIDPQGAHTPHCLRFDDRRINVAQVRDRWDGPNYRYYKLIGEDGNLYIVRHDETQNTWDLKLFQSVAGQELPKLAGSRERYH